MDIPVTNEPLDLVADQSLSSGDTLNFSVSSDKSAVFLARVDDEPEPGDFGIRLEYGMRPYPMEVLSSPGKLWVWAADGDSADLAYSII